jgi:prephenate dehydratase
VVADRWRADDLKAEGCIGKNIDKANIVFSLPHQEGSLSQILSIFTFYRINLTKIQSLPIIGREWEYRFFINLTFDDLGRYHQSLNAIRPLIKDFKILGEYENFKPANE